ncbi:hypothetical protein [Azospirillum melinis]
MFGQPNTAEDGGSGRTFMYKFGTPPAYISVKDSVTRRTYGNIYLNFDSKETVRSVNLF